MDYKLFSGDEHMDLHFLPANLWNNRLPAAYQDKAPRIEDSPEGRRWVVEGAPFGSFLGLVPPNDHFRGRAGTTLTPLQHDGTQWAPTTPELRLRDRDRDGVEGHVLYGPFLAFQLNDPRLNALCMRAYNDWVAEFSKASPNRLIGTGILPVNDADAAVAELRHCAKLGLKGAQFHAFAAYKFQWDEAWEPLWAAAEEEGIVISFHEAGGSWSCDSVGSKKRPANRGVGATFHVTTACRLDEVLCSLILSGVMKKYPSLRIVLAECSIGWIPFTIESMDRKYMERHIQSRRDDAVDLDMAPSQYYKRQMRATFQEDPVGVRLLDLMGPETAMWASDYPHPDGVWPNSHSTVDRLFKGIDPKITKMVVSENAKKLYA